MIFCYLLSIPAWLLAASVVSQFYTHTRGPTTLHPIRHLPLIGLVGAISQFLVLTAAKGVPLGDMLLVIMVADLLSAAVVAVCLLGLERQDMHDHFVKEYVLRGINM